ncbi:MAG TPA: tetratricopeptide repeat protein, partial [Azospirillum sp.]
MHPDDTPPDDALRAAVAHHQAGRLGEAEAAYTDILRHDPLHADALHLKGVVCAQTGRGAEAVGLIARAVVRNPASAAYRANLDKAMRAAGSPQAVAAGWRG